MNYLPCKFCHGAGKLALQPAMQAALDCCAGEEGPYKSQHEILLEMREQGYSVSAARLSGYLLRLTLHGFLTRIHTEVKGPPGVHQGFKYKRGERL